MLLRWRWVIEGLLLIAMSFALARADINWVNYLQSNPDLHRVKKYDLNGHGMDLGEDADLKQFGGTIYLYTMSSAQGWIPNINSPANGFRVYSFPDLVNPTDEGQLLDTTQSPLSTDCTGITPGVNYHACWAPRMGFNTSTGKFVFFYEAYGSGTQAVRVFECSTPKPQPTCTYIGPLAGYVPGSADNIAVQFDEQSNDAFLVFNNGGGGTIFIQKLTADWHGLTGSATNTGLTGENVWMKHPGTKWMIGAGPLCGECAGATESFVWSTTWNGTYGGLTQLSPTGGCGTQGAMIADIFAGGIKTYLYVATHFQSGAGQSQGQTTLHLEPLTLTGDLFDPFTCHGTVTIPGITSTGAYPTPAYPRTFDINFMSSLNSSFHDICNLGTVVGATGLMQQFVPTVAPLNAIALNLARCTMDGNVPDGSIEVDVTTDSANTPGTILASHTYAASSLPWVSQFTPTTVSLTLTPGTTYDVVVKVVGNTKGAFTYTLAEPTSALYGSNLVRYSTDNGASWTTIANDMMQVSTFPAAAPIVPPLLMMH